MTICGLDFGTSNSTIALLEHSQPVMVPLEQDTAGQWKTTLPSALFFGFEDDDVNVGRHAIGRYTAGEPGRLLRSMKSLLGGSFMGDKTQVKNRLYTFDEIIGFFINVLKAKAEAYSGVDTLPLESVVMGRPVYFNDNDNALDRDAENLLGNIAKSAGFKEVSFQFEPIAAAMDYERKVKNEELALIIDIGGGTSDFTLIKLSPDRHGKQDRQQDFLASHGVHIGGTDFDRQLSISGVMPEFGMEMPLTNKPGLKMPGSIYYDLATWHKIHLLYDNRVRLELKNMRPVVSDKAKLDRLLELLLQRKAHHLASLVEQAKIALSDKPEVIVDLESLFVNSKSVSVDNCVLTQSQLKESLQRDLEIIFKTLQESLTQAGLTHQCVDTIFTTGGSTALPMIQSCINTAFPNARQIAGDLYNSVGTGLLMEAKLRYQ